MELLSKQKSLLNFVEVNTGYRANVFLSNALIRPVCLSLRQYHSLLITVILKGARHKTIIYASICIKCKLKCPPLSPMRHGGGKRRC